MSAEACKPNPGQFVVACRTTGNRCWGPAIDNIVVEFIGSNGAGDPVPAPAALPLFAGAIAGLGWPPGRRA